MQYDDPFLLFVGYQQAHVPQEVDAVFMKMLAKRCASKGACKKMEKDRKIHLGNFINYCCITEHLIVFSAQILSLDESANTIIRLLKKQGQFKNTIIVFMSDVGRP